MVKKTLASLLLAGSFALSSCATNTGSYVQIMDPQKTQVRSLHKKKEGYTVALLPDRPASFHCQRRIYHTLEHMKDSIRFVAKAGNHSAVEHTSLRGPLYLHDIHYGLFERGKAHKGGSKFEDLVSVPLEIRKIRVQSWLENNMYPVAPKQTKHPLNGTLLFEAVYQDQVITAGVEGMVAPGESRASVLSREHFLAHPNLDEERTKHFVENVMHIADRLPGGNIVPLVAGYRLIPSLVKGFRKKDVPTVVIGHQDCVPKGD